MKKKSMKLMTILGACVLAMGMMTGCGAQSSNHADTGSVNINSANSGSVETNVELSGKIQLVGSTSMEKLSSALAEGFMEKYPDITVSVEYVGSSAGIEAILGGTSDIGNSSRNLKEQEKADGAVENIVAIDGIAVCVDNNNTVDGLTKEELTKIYTGEISNWSQVGGQDVPVIVIGREAGSGTRGAFEEILGVEDVCAYVNELDSTGAVKAKVGSTPGAIGYISMDSVDDSIKALALEGVAATTDNVKAGNYFLSRPFVMATKGEISEQNALVQEWFAYVLGDEGQDIAASVGLITVE